jgi:hypothetical protein
MSDLILALQMFGILKYIIAVIVAFGAIALYFGFIKKA